MRHHDIKEASARDKVRLMAGDTLTVGDYERGVPNELIITEEWLQKLRLGDVFTLGRGEFMVVEITPLPGGRLQVAVR